MQLPIVSSHDKGDPPNVDRFTQFEKLYNMLKKHPATLLKDIVACLKIKLKLDGFFCFLDEAHVLINASDSLPSDSPVKQGKPQRYRAPLSVLVQATLQLSVRMVCAGTRLRLPDLTIVQSGASKLSPCESGPQAFVVACFPFLEEEKVLDQLRRFSRSLDTVPCAMLVGRARLWASFADVLLHRLQEATTTDLQMVVEASLHDFVRFHVHAEGSNKLQDVSRSLRHHFDQHLESNPVSPDDKSFTLHIGLVDLVTAGLLALGEPATIDSSKADWVSGGVCFLHEDSGGTRRLSCKEPLVLDAITASVGVDVMVEAVCKVWEKNKLLLGTGDASKGTLFQHLTVSKLLAVSRAENITLGALLQIWGVDTSEGEVMSWLQGVSDNVIAFRSVIKDCGGSSLPLMVANSQEDKILVLANAGRAEYIGLVKQVVMTCGCKLYTTTNSREFDDNEATTDISNLFKTRAGEAHCQTQHDEVHKALGEKVRAGKLTHSLRLVFSISKTKNSRAPRPFIQVKKVDRYECTMHDLILTFTRRNVNDFFRSERVLSLIESFFPSK